DKGKQLEGILFVDVDYPELMRRKTDIVRENEVLANQVTNVEHSDAERGVMLRAVEYIAVGCDLKNLADLDGILRHELKLQDCEILFMAEVSIAYMPVMEADAVVKWASTFEDCQSHFCLLEQFLPAGADHPFAKTMLEHFAKQTPLKCVHAYPRLEEQRMRFVNNGWAEAEIGDLWALWQDPGFIPAAEKLEVDAVEPFDEWEEFALFAGHYLVLVAKTACADSDTYLPAAAKGLASAKENSTTLSANLCSVSCGNGASRRFGAVFSNNLIQTLDTPMSSEDNDRSSPVAYHGGITAISKAPVYDVYQIMSSQAILDGPPEDVMCHTITTLCQDNFLMVGGRTSPSKASSRCWLRLDGVWARTHDLLPARYRHCAVKVELEGRAAVLVHGGKTSSGEVLGDWQLWQPDTGWCRVHATSPDKELASRFGAAMVLKTTTETMSTGLLAGGMD
ncbi:hypothetical protein LTS18_013361, partial [Coniosporium uncinatum]